MYSFWLWLPKWVAILGRCSEVPKSSKFVFNDRYQNKEHGNKVFQLDKVNEDHCLFIHTPLFDARVEEKVPFLQLKEWRPTKTSMSVACPAAKAESHMVHQNQAVQLELQRSHVQKCLLQACMDNDPTHKDLVFSSSPSNVWSLKKFTRKSSLKLFPCGTVSLLKGTPVADKHYVKAFGKMWLIGPMKNLQHFEKDEGVLSPFWWVKLAGDGEDHNMAFGEVSLDECKIPVLQNIGAIQPHECLLLENPKLVGKKKRKQEQ